MAPIADDQDEEEPIAAWEALLLPGWRWEAFEREDEGLYYGRVKSPRTYGDWEWGYFTQGQLSEAEAYRVDDDPDGNEPVFPDGGGHRLYETELAAQDAEGDYRSDG